MRQEPDLSAKKVAGVAVSYSKEHRIGQILISDEDNQIDQYFDVWGKSRDDFSPVLITYVFEKGDYSIDNTKRDAILTTFFPLKNLTHDPAAESL